MERWATFDCYGTLVDWNGGIGDELARLFGGDRRVELLAAYHALEPVIEHDGSLPYREVLARTLACVAEGSGLDLPEGERDALGRSLPGWPVFPEVPGALREARARGWRLAILSNSDRDLIDASAERIGVPFDRTIVAGEIGYVQARSRSLARVSRPVGRPPRGPRPRRCEPLPRRRSRDSARPADGVDQPPRRGSRPSADP